VGITEKSGPGKIVGEDAPPAQKQVNQAPPKPAGGPMDFREQLKLRLAGQVANSTPSKPVSSLPKTQKTLPTGKIFISTSFWHFRNDRVA
jgi:hypothetical protein